MVASGMLKTIGSILITMAIIEDNAGVVLNKSTKLNILVPYGSLDSTSWV
jgi:hypothetical protein